MSLLSIKVVSDDYFSLLSVMNVLPTVAFHNNVVSVGNDKIIFHVELNISVVSLLRVVNALA